MDTSVSDTEFRALAELRHRIRKFVQDGDTTAREIGLEPQQYLLLLALRGLPTGSEASIRTLAERLFLQHHSAVELVDRMEQRGYVKRTRSTADRRQVLVSLQGRGEKLLQKVAEKRLIELRSSGQELVAAISALLETASSNGNRPKRSSKRKRANTQEHSSK